MSIERLQACIRRRKTPVALVLNPVEERLDGKFLNNFTNMYGDCPMAHAEALRYHGSRGHFPDGGAAAGGDPAGQSLTCVRDSWGWMCCPTW
ncbi:MAG: hypothetical protein ACLUS6_03820 [Dysosmobacter sp.]